MRTLQSVTTSESRSDSECAASATSALEWIAAPSAPCQSASVPAGPQHCARPHLGRRHAQVHVHAEPRDAHGLGALRVPRVLRVLRNLRVGRRTGLSRAEVAPLALERPRPPL